MDLNEIAVFIEVVRAGSFSKAAQRLEMPNSTVSAKVSSLEKRLGLTLITRTTRKLQITPAGQTYYDRCVRGLEEIGQAESEVREAKGEPQGLLRITAPVELGVTLLPDVVARFIKKYPRVNVELVLSDARVDLLADRIDLAVRGGELKDSSLVAKSLGALAFTPVASPRYLKTVKAPEQPRDLLQHNLLLYSGISAREWKLTNGRGQAAIPVDARLAINDLRMIRDMALRGSGIALLPPFLFFSEVRAGHLVRVLPGWHAGKTPLHFVYPAQKHVPLKLSSFINMAADEIRAELKRYEEI